MEINLKLAKSIVGSLTVNVKEHPEYLEKMDSGSYICKRNMLVAQAMLAIDELQKSI